MRSLSTRPSWIHHALAVLVTGGLLSMAASCSVLEKIAENMGDHAGSACKGKTGLCKGDSTALICNDGKYAEVACRGPKGCSISGGNMSCDSSLNSEDDKCPAVWEGTGSCRGTSKWVGCHDGAYVVLDCRGKTACKQTGTTSNCDQGVVDEGDACTDEDTASCSESGSEKFICKKGKMGSPVPCRGPEKCHSSPDGKKILCDQSLGKEGDTCQSAGGACSVDGSATLHCANGKYVVSHICRGGGPCKTENEMVACGNMGLSEAGDPCSGDIAACTVDGKAFLSCKNGKFEQTRKCNRCTSDGKAVTCQ